MEKYLLANEKLYKDVYGEGHQEYNDGKVSNFVAMKGANYDKNQEIRFMYVGRATNGWGDGIKMENAKEFAKSVKEVFEAGNRFETEWKMQDTETNPYSVYIGKNKEGKDVEKKYYLSRSKFWMSGHDIWCKLNGIDTKPDWFNEIVWNNIYKVAPSESGNPSTKLIYAQAPACQEILKEEINELKPTHVLLVVDKDWLYWKSYNEVKVNWMSIFEGCIDCDDAIVGEGVYAQKAFIYNGIKFVVTCRPETVNRVDYVDAVVKTFEKMSKQKR